MDPGTLEHEISKINLVRRWEQGTPHHPRAEELARLIGKIDFQRCSDSLCLKFGGDGDNGENLCYILSEIFERGLFKP